MDDITHAAGEQIVAGERSLDHLVDRYGGFLAPLIAVVLLAAAWIVGEHSLQGFYLAVAAMAICGYPILRNAIYSTITNRKLNPLRRQSSLANMLPAQWLR